MTVHLQAKQVGGLVGPAIRFFTVAVSLRPSAVFDWYDLAECFNQQRKMDEAITV